MIVRDTASFDDDVVVYSRPWPLSGRSDCEAKSVSRVFRFPLASPLAYTHRVNLSRETLVPLTLITSFFIFFHLRLLRRILYLAQFGVRDANARACVRRRVVAKLRAWEGEEEGGGEGSVDESRRKSITQLAMRARERDRHDDDDSRVPRQVRLCSRSYAREKECAFRTLIEGERERQTENR